MPGQLGTLIQSLTQDLTAPKLLVQDWERVDPSSIGPADTGQRTNVGSLNHLTAKFWGEHLTLASRYQQHLVNGGNN